jgi:hypothetical protein
MPLQELSSSFSFATMPHPLTKTGTVLIAADLSVRSLARRLSPAGSHRYANALVLLVAAVSIS